MTKKQTTPRTSTGETIDCFSRAREVLAKRQVEIVAKYPGTSSGFSDSHIGIARDQLFFLERAMIDRQSSREAIADMVDMVLLTHMTAVSQNEKGASAELHAHIAWVVHLDAVTPAMREVQIAMHNALRLGLPAEEATLMKPLSGRPTAAAKHRAIRRFIAGEDGMRELMKAAGKPREWRTRDASYKEAARLFDTSIKTVKNICSE